MSSVPLLSSTPPFDGVGAALMTCFDDAGELDAPATAAHAARLVDAGVRGVVVAGTTGEATALDADERIRLLEAVRGAVPLDVPVLAGTGAPSARQASALTADAAKHGADGALVLSPARVTDPRAYYAAVADVAGAQRRLVGPHLQTQRSFPHGLKQLVAERFGTPVAARLGERPDPGRHPAARTDGWSAPSG